MLTSGDVVDIDLGSPTGRGAGFPRPAVVVTAQRILDASPSVVHIVPLTTAVRGFSSEIAIDPDAGNGLTEASAAQCQHVRAVSARRIGEPIGNVGAVALAEIREILDLILDIPNR